MYWARVMELRWTMSGSLMSGKSLRTSPYLRLRLSTSPTELDLVGERNGKLPEEGGLVGGGDQLALHDNGELGLVDEAAGDPELVGEGSDEAVVAVNDLGAHVVDVLAHLLGEGAATAVVLLFEEEDVLVLESVGDGETGDAAAYDYGVEGFGVGGCHGRSGIV